MKRIFAAVAVAFLATAAGSAPSLAGAPRDLDVRTVSDTVVVHHSGGTDAAGCHKNHKTGGYHCH